MPQTLAFIPWRRSGSFEFTTSATTVGGRLKGELNLSAVDTETGHTRSGTVAFELQGPADVKLQKGAVKRRVPPKYTTDAETTLMTHVELSELDIPWRHTPLLAAGSDNRVLRPWIVLVVGTAEEVSIGDSNTVTLSGGVLDSHPLAQSAAWAHLQVELDPPLEDDQLSLNLPDLINFVESRGGSMRSRLVSPRLLESNTEYVAALVPAFGAGGSDAWTNSTTPVVLYCEEHWTFRTGEAGDFRTLCAALRPASATGGLGAADVAVDLPVGSSSNVAVRGAIAQVGSDDPALSQQITQATASLLGSARTDERGRPVLTLPVYGSEWQVDAPALSWGQKANHDPRFRGIGGLGLSAGIQLQDEIFDAIIEQIGPQLIINQRLTQLSAGLSATRSLWDRRLHSSPRENAAIFWAATAKMHDTNLSILDRASEVDRPLPRALFSSAARRIFRPGPARSRHAVPGANAPAAVLEAANKCPPAPTSVVDGLPHFDVVSDKNGLPDAREVCGLDAIDPERFLEGLKDLQSLLPARDDARLFQQMIEQLRRSVREGKVIDIPAVLDLVQEIIGGGEKLGDTMRKITELSGQDHPRLDLKPLIPQICRKPMPRPCRPVDLDEYTRVVTDAVDPSGDDAWMIVRVTATLDGPGTDSGQPVEPCTSVNLPAWRFLRDVAPDWLLPGVGQLDRDRVYAFQSNARFVDSFLLGLNGQALAECRWRNVRIASGCTPLRVFWGRIGAGGGDPVDDIRGVHLWPDQGGGLGVQANRPSTVTPDNLILVFSTALFRRYPDTIVSAISADLDNNGDPDFSLSAVPDGSKTRHWPVFQGAIGEDVAFFGFDFVPDDGMKMWFLIEEPPPGYRFRNTDDQGDPLEHRADGANFADYRFNEPTRVVIRGGELID